MERTRSLLADEVTFVGPLGATQGVDDYIKGIIQMANIVERAEEKEIFGEGDNVCIIYDLVFKNPEVSIPTAGWYQIKEDKIIAVRAYFDPRPLVESV